MISISAVLVNLTVLLLPCFRRYVHHICIHISNNLTLQPTKAIQHSPHASSPQTYPPVSPPRTRNRVHQAA